MSHCYGCDSDGECAVNDVLHERDALSARLKRAETTLDDLVAAIEGGYDAPTEEAALEAARAFLSEREGGDRE